MLENIFHGMSLILGLKSILGITFGVTLGITVGAIPGLTGNMAVAILLPITYYMEPWVSIPMLIGIHKGSIYGGSISAILLGVPGTPAAAATMMDGYVLAKAGKAPMRGSLYLLVLARTEIVFSPSWKSPPTSNHPFSSVQRGGCVTCSAAFPFT